VSGLHPLWTLIPISAAFGLVVLWIFGRMSNQQGIRETKRKIAARLYELRLFIDEPKLMWQAHLGLLRDNVRYLGYMLVPAVVITIPTLILFGQLDAIYGLSPLAPGRPAIVTVQLNQPIRIEDRPAIQLPDGFITETPPVRVLGTRQISWRVRPARAASGSLTVTAAGGSVTKSICAEPGVRYLSKRRVSSITDFMWHPTETRISNAAINWIEVDYPAAEIDLAGISLHWLTWLLIVSMAVAFLMRRRFGVSF
jgi:hypothetical protein